MATALATDKIAIRFQAYCNIGFAEIVAASTADIRISKDLARHLADRHGITLRPSIVRRWLTSGQLWQEPRVTVGIIILEWWRNNRHSYQL